MNLHIISNITMQPLSRELGWANVTFDRHANVAQSLLYPESEVDLKAIDYIYCHLDEDQFLGEKQYQMTSSDDWSIYINTFKKWCDENPKQHLIVSLLCQPIWSIASHYELLARSNTSNKINEFNQCLIRLTEEHPNLHLLDVSKLFQLYGYNQLINTNLWYLARVKYSKKMFLCLAEYLTSIITAVDGKAKKVLVLDLDNTLWGGVIGEQGLGGISLSEEGKGKCYRDFQRMIKGLSSVGVLIAINSKNNYEDARLVFEQHEMMVLDLDEFAAIRINWNNKAENLLEIANELNLGLDSFVFIDDNPVERQLIKTNFPQVTVPEFPRQAEQLVRWMFESVIYPYFPRVRLTQEDSNRTKQYHARIKRDKSSKNIDYQRFLESLEINLQCSWNQPNHFPRASQMSHKTNQFNLTTRRYAETEIKRLVEKGSHAVLMVSYLDKFMDEGLIGCAILNIPEKQIDAFFLSCRVIGREVEDFMIAEIERYFTDLKINMVQSTYIPSPKNNLVKNLYEKFNYNLELIDHNLAKFYSKKIS